jgi:DNA polymerase-1
MDGYKLLHQGTLAFARAERQGIRVDVKRAKKQKKKLTKKIIKLTKEIKDSKFYKDWENSAKPKKVNMNSNPQLAKYLYNVLELHPIKLTTSGMGGTSEEALQALNIPELNKMLRIRKLKKLRDTYLDAYIREAINGYIHPSLNLHLVRTYRSSSDSPNMQNVPVRDEEAKKIIRKLIYPRLGHQLMEIDYGKLEVCIAACYHKDPTMIRYIKDSKADMHRDMAQQIFFINDWDNNFKAHKTLRSGAKNGFVFPQFYGDYYVNNAMSLCKWGNLSQKGIWKPDTGLILPGDTPLAAHLKNNGISSSKDFQEHLRRIEKHFWEVRFPVYNDWKEKWYKAYQKKGYFDTLTGFRCGGVMSKHDTINYPVQGSAFHCLLWSFIELDRIMRRDKWDTRLIGQVHDSIIFDVLPEELKHVIEVVKRVTCIDLRKMWDWIIVPLTIEAEVCEVDQPWYYKKEINI